MNKNQLETVILSKSSIYTSIRNKLYLGINGRSENQFEEKTNFEEQHLNAAERH